MSALLLVWLLQVKKSLLDRKSTATVVQMGYFSSQETRFQLVTGRVWRGSAFGGVKGRTEIPGLVEGTEILSVTIVPASD